MTEVRKNSTETTTIFSKMSKVGVSAKADTPKRRFRFGVSALAETPTFYIFMAESLEKVVVSVLFFLTSVIVVNLGKF